MRKEHVGIIRNPIAQEPKIKFVVEEEEALDLMASILYIHKRLDKAEIVKYEELRVICL